MRAGVAPPMEAGGGGGFGGLQISCPLLCRRYVRPRGMITGRRGLLLAWASGLVSGRGCAGARARRGVKAGGRGTSLGFGTTVTGGAVRRAGVIECGGIHGRTPSSLKGSKARHIVAAGAARPGVSLDANNKHEETTEGVTPVRILRTRRGEAG